MAAKLEWTVVQHSAYGYNDDTGFRRGLESRRIQNKTERNLITAVGGLIFDDYIAAENFAHGAMYPLGVMGLTPAAQGKFSPKKIDGLRIYIPVRQVVG